MNDLSQLRGFVEHNEPKTYTEYPPVPDDLVEPWQRADWIFRHSNAPWLKLLIDAPFKDMLAEARALRHRFVRHREGDGEGWMSLCVHGISAEMTDSHQAYNIDAADAVYDWTDIADQCPVTVDYFKNHFPYKKYQRLRFMLMEPGGYIMPHSDNKQSNVGAAVNFSLNHPPRCRMVTERGVLPFEDSGSVFLFNNHYMHAVVNDDTEERYHMIVHGEWDPVRWNEIVCKSYEAARNG